MIGRLTGKVEQEDEGNVLVDVRGVGYELMVPLGTLGRARGEDGTVTLFVHTHVREDALVLFGFASAEERLAFRTLISISNVGPKTAVGILSALPASELSRAVAAKDVATLTSIPGVGKKTAERLMLELRDKLGSMPAAAAPKATTSATSPVASSGKPGDVLLSALTRMGYRPVEAERAVGVLSDRLETTPLETLLREALAFLSK